MALTFIPEIWSAMILESLKKELVYAGPGVATRKWEGDIANQGDTVRIRSVSRPTIATYTKGSTTITPEQLTDAQRSLVINQAKYFAFEVDDVDAAQSPGGEMEEALVEAVYGLRDAADQYVASLYTDASATNAISTVSITTAALAYTGLKNLKVKLDTANVPLEGRYVIVPPWYHGLLLEDTKFVTVNASGTSEGLRNGIVGRALGMDILVSNNVPVITGDDYAVMAGHSSAIAYAEQINKIEAYRPQDSFSDALKGLHLYGAKVVRPDALAVMTASIT
jgi:hypothetical protein